MKKYFGVLLLAIIGIGSGCDKESEKPTYDCTTVSPTYTNQVKTILDSECATAGCHNAVSKKAGLDYSTYEEAKEGAMDNNFFGSIHHLDGYDAMPEDAPKLSDTQLQLLTCWVESGTPE